MNRNLELFAQYHPALSAIDLYFYRHDLRTGNRTRLVVAEAETIEPCEYRPCEPSLVVDEVAAQRLMDQLWACGLRPTEGKGSAGALAATERHLADMRQIAFSRLGIPPNDPDRPNLLGNGR